MKYTIIIDKERRNQGEVEADTYRAGAVKAAAIQLKAMGAGSYRLTSIYNSSTHSFLITAKPEAGEKISMYITVKKN